MLDLVWDPIHMNGRIYDPRLGRFLQADPFVQASRNSQSLNRYSYVLNNPLSYTDPSGYFFKRFIKKWGRLIAASVATYFTAGAASAWVGGFAWGSAAGSLTAAGAAVAGAISGAVGGAILTGTLKGAFYGALTGAALGGIRASGWGDPAKILASGGANGITTELQGGKFGHGFLSAGAGFWSGLKFGGEPSVGNFFGSAIAGGTISELTGGKFENGAFSAALAYAVAATDDFGDSGFDTVGESKVLSNPDNSGTAKSLFDGKVLVRKWGSIGAEVSEADLSQVQSDLETIFGTKRGSVMLGKLSNTSPLNVFLNDLGENIGTMGGLSLTVDLATNAMFHDIANPGSPPVSVSTTRLLAHEMGHAIFSTPDLANLNIRMNSDPIMHAVSGTQRKFDSNVWYLRK